MFYGLVVYILAFNSLNDGNDAGFHTTGIIALSKLWSNAVAIDPARLCIGEHAFETAAHFHSHLPIFNSDEKQHTVVSFRLTEFPFVVHAIAIRIDIVAFE